MKSIATLLVLSALVASAASIAAPSSSDTSAAAALQQLSKETSNLPHKGKVISAIDTSQYTFIEVAQDKKTLWLAVPTVAVKKNNVIRFEDGAEMTNFHSKSLNRTFPSIWFINRVVVTDEKL